MHSISVDAGHRLRDPLQDLLYRSSKAMLVLAAITAISTNLHPDGNLQDYYFSTQDLPLLLAGAGVLLLMSRQVFLASRPFNLTGQGVVLSILAAGIVAYIGSWLVIERYAQSRDEAMAEFAARYIQAGLLGLPIPPALRDVSLAAMPGYTGIRSGNSYWVSDYLPFNATLRALAGLFGDRWLAGPALLTVGVTAVWHAARRIWPEQREAATMAVLLAVTSTQLAANAMTPFATTAHFALNAVWLVCFLRGGRTGHALAIMIGMVASGLHQFHFHMLFVAGFIVWLWRSDRRPLAMLYLGACLGYYAIWDMAYPRLLSVMLAPPTGSVMSTPLLGAIVARLGRLAELQPLTSAARFVAWENILLMPLAFLGARIRRDEDGRLPIAHAFTMSCVIGLLLMPWQGFGLGYRYLHHLMPCFLLLAGAGALRLRDEGRPLPRKLVQVSALFAVFVTAPYALWQSHRLLAPYAAAEQTLRRAPADIVLVDPLAGAFVQDLVRIENPAARPLLLDLGSLTDAQIDILCRERKVMLFGHREASALRIIGGDPSVRLPDYGVLYARQRRLRVLGCDHPIPLS